jgi:PAS domain S-box-containing protein
MNWTSEQTDIVRLLTTSTDPTTPEAPTARVLPLLVQITGSRAIFSTGPEGNVEIAAHRPGTVHVPDPPELRLSAAFDAQRPWRPAQPPRGWVAAGVTIVTVHRIPDGLGTFTVAWDSEPGEAIVAWLHLVFALLDERRMRKHSEEQLTDLTARVDNAQRLANMGDYDWHIATDTNRWSAQLYRIYGHEPQSFNASYDRFLSHVHPDDRERIQQIHRRAYETGEPYEMIERVLRPDGSTRFLSSNGQVLRDESGTPVRMRGTCIDITDRVLAEQARERLAARFRNLVESAPDAIIVLDTHGTIVQANRGAHELLGGDPVGTLAEKISPDLRTAGHDLKANSLHGRALELDVTVAELNDADGEGLIAVYLRDSAVRHADEARAAALREAQVRHQQAVEINDDVIQGLTAAILTMQMEDMSGATHYLEKTLVAARRLMNDWSGGPQNAAVRPGDLVRSLASALPENFPDSTDPQPAGAPPAATRRILVVDDSADVRMLLCAQLRSLGRGTVVGEAADGARAIELAATLQPDLVLLDLSMPRMDGLEALPHILDAVSHVKVVVMSGFAECSVAEQVLAAGASRYVEKGLRMNLAAVIDDVFETTAPGWSAS